MSIAEIAARQLVSRVMVRTQAISIYFEFGVTWRSEALSARRRGGLIGSEVLL